MNLNQDFQEFVELFVANDVEFLIGGGCELAAHGRPRYTKDLNVSVWLEPENTQRIISALEEFGFGNLGLTAAADFQEPDVMVQLGRELQRIDIFTYASGLQFSDAYKNRVSIPIGKVQMPFISEDDLRTNKLATGRHETLLTSLICLRLSNLDVDRAECGGEFRTTFRTIPRPREAGAKFHTSVLMGQWLGFQ